MPFKILNSILPEPLKDQVKAEQLIATRLTRVAKMFKQETKEKMVEGPHTGVLYQRKSIGGGRRFHRASARFERPSPDTFNLVNSVEDTKISNTKHTVQVNESRAPYGGILESERFERVIMSEQDVTTFADGKMSEEMEKLRQSLMEG